MMGNQLIFKGKTLTPTILNNRPYLGVHQISVALQYARDDIVNKMYRSHADEFTPDMSFLIEVKTAGGKQQARVFSLRGCHLLAMFSKTPVAKEFRRWVLDIIEYQTEPKQDIKQALYDYFGETVYNEENLPKIRAVFQQWVRRALKPTDSGLKDWCAGAIAQIIEAQAKFMAEEKFKAYALENKKLLDKHLGKSERQVFIENEVKKLFKENADA